jgi:hypothetical protein
MGSTSNGSDDRLTARGALVRVAARQTLDCKEDGFFP